jgi:zinc D-Ala-D-Ala carboxypeptidase
MQLSKHLSKEELEHSDIAVKNGIDNTLPDDLIPRAKILAEFLFEPIRDALDTPIHINSGWRCEELNRLVGGVSTSQHARSEAIDMVPADMPLLKALRLILQSGLIFDQIILEGMSDNNPHGTWIHASYATSNRANNRNMILLCNDKKKYTQVTRDQALNFIQSQVF